MTGWAVHEQRLMAAFRCGTECEQRGGYRSDNPHPYESDLWQAWLAGYEEELGPEYRVAA